MANLLQEPTNTIWKTVIAREIDALSSAFSSPQRHGAVGGSSSTMRRRHPRRGQVTIDSRKMCASRSASELAMTIPEPDIPVFTISESHDAHGKSARLARSWSSSGSSLPELTSSSMSSGSRRQVSQAKWDEISTVSRLSLPWGCARTSLRERWD
eukprot:TRINITY_DN14110_c0_g3_i1.p1 TRINITY_DN14110_c0_g3~~TRINITY_DN14110_c0_g3_i1.p1  ORF type:complete len:155 (+),score=5.66 TRINITY_DN14110_c0_g3_i1:106-570(+)